MKKMKKVMALLLSLVMVLAMSIATFAGEGSAVSSTTYTITIKNAETGHTYEAYQIFAGTLSEGVLSDISWGDGVSVFEYGNTNVAKDIAKTLTDANAADFASVAGGKLTAITSGKYSNGKITDLTAGYYLVKDKGPVSGHSSYTSYLLKVAGNVEVTPKTGVPTVEKKVKENVKTVNENGTETDSNIPSYQIPAKYNDVADYNIGDKVPFQLVGTMPSNIDKYEHYYYEFADTLSNGLTYNGDAVVKIDGNSIDGSKVTVKINGNSLKVIFNDIKEVAAVTKDSIVTVDYTATLNSDAVIGLDGNPNEVKLIFSNNPNMTGDGTGKPDDTGETPIDKVIVFTYELDVEKVDGTNTATKLKDAEFVLKRKVGENTEYAVVNNKERLEKWVASIDDATKLVTGADGLVKVAGLDDGTYYLEETKAPSQYNKLSKDVEIVISTKTKNNQIWTGTASDALTKIEVTVTDVKTVKTDGNVKSGSVKVTVENYKGSELPSTGGMGTTIFYVVGSILVLGAAILLITKKRMSAR